MKSCKDCNRSLPETSFSKKSDKKDGLDIRCRDCKSKKAKALYRSSPNQTSKILARNKKKTQTNREYIKSFLQNKSCVDCGEMDIRVLEFDHVRGEKSFNISSAPARQISVQTLQSELDKCDIRCGNCHRIKTAIQFDYLYNRWYLEYLSTGKVDYDKK